MLHESGEESGAEAEFVSDIFETARVAKDVNLDVLASVKDGSEVAIVVIEVWWRRVAGEAGESLTE